jgi:hypothetical protein
MRSSEYTANEQLAACDVRRAAVRERRALEKDARMIARVRLLRQLTLCACVLFPLISYAAAVVLTR